MSDIEQPQQERQVRADWSGTLIGLSMLPVFLLFVYFGKAEMGFTVAIILALVVLAIKLRWNLRRHGWFWVTIVVVLALHIPLIFLVRWPQTHVPTIAYSMPLGVADFLAISGALSLAEKLFSKDSSSNDEVQ
jgi:hypothetical protein